MKHYTKPDGSLWAFESDGTQDHLITSEFTPVTDAALAEIRKPDPQVAVANQLAQLRNLREQLLNRLAGIALAAQMSGDQTTAAAYLTVRTALLDLTVSLPTDPAAMRALLIQRYAAAVALAPASLRTAFSGLNL